MMKFSKRTSTVGYILAFLIGGLLAEDNLNAVTPSTLWWAIGIGMLWLYLVFSDIKRRIDYLEEVYHV